MSPVCEMVEKGSCAAIIDADMYGEAEVEEPGRPTPTAPPSGPPANPENRGGKYINFMRHVSVFCLHKFCWTHQWTN